MKKRFLVFVMFLMLTPGRTYAGAAEDRMARAVDLLIELNENGLTRPVYEMRSRQGMIFIFNNTSATPVTFQFFLGSSAPTCFTSVTPNIEFREDGTLVSSKPLEPGNFASTCLPHVGEFNFEIFGLSQPTRGVLKIVAD